MAQNRGNLELPRSPSSMITEASMPGLIPAQNHGEDDGFWPPSVPEPADRMPNESIDSDDPVWPIAPANHIDLIPERLASHR